MENRPQIDDDTLRKALQNECDIGELSSHIQKELRALENETVDEYLVQADEVAELHTQIKECDNILARMEKLLGGFQENLGEISAEIQSLQEQSVVMNVKLTNRQGVRGELSQLVDDMVISDTMIKTILENDPSETSFLEQLHELQHKLAFWNQSSMSKAIAATEVSSVLLNLKHKAIEKLRDFILQRIYQFRKPLANYTIPQNTLLKFRFYFEFLQAHDSIVAQEIKTEYIDTTSKMYCSYFKTYGNRLEKLLSHTVSSTDLLGSSAVTEKVSSSSASSLFSSLMTSMGGSHHHTSSSGHSTNNSQPGTGVFSLGNRIDILEQLDAPIIVPHVSAENGIKFTLEHVFRSLNCAFVDNTTREYHFIHDFFILAANDCNVTFMSVMGRTISIVHKRISQEVQSCCDVLAVLLCIHISNKYRARMMEHKLDLMNNAYWISILEHNLWPRFETLMLQHAESLRSCQAESSTLNSGAAALATASRTHYIVRRYAEFVASITSINVLMPDERILIALKRLKAEIENFIVRLSDVFVAAKRHRCLVLINNYCSILDVLKETRCEKTEEAVSFQNSLDTATAEYVTDVLHQRFGYLISVVCDSEQLIHKNRIDELMTKYSNEIPRLAKKFSVEWRNSLQEVNKEIAGSFSNWEIGSTVVQQALTSVVDYYHRFQKILSNPAISSVASKTELINMHHLMVEVKKYKSSF